MGHSDLRADRPTSTAVSVSTPSPARHDHLTLSGFLRSRRARLSPADVEVLHSGQRRVPGLRREEVAQLAGLSASYYTRIEQGQVDTPSEPVLDSLARALHLTPDECRYVRRIVRDMPTPARAGHGRCDPKEAVRSFTNPALALSPALEITGMNAAARRLHSEFSGALTHDDDPRTRNIATILFLEPGVERTVIGVGAVRRRVAGLLRFQLARHRSAEVRSVIESVLAESEPFRRLWNDHVVHDLAPSVLAFRRPDGGRAVFRVDFVRGPAPTDAVIAFLTPR